MFLFYFFIIYFHLIPLFPFFFFVLFFVLFALTVDINCKICHIIHSTWWPGLFLLMWPSWNTHCIHIPFWSFNTANSKTVYEINPPPPPPANSITKTKIQRVSSARWAVPSLPVLVVVPFRCCCLCSGCWWWSSVLWEPGLALNNPSLAIMTDRKPCAAPPGLLPLPVCIPGLQQHPRSRINSLSVWLD